MPEDEKDAEKQEETSGGGPNKLIFLIICGLSLILIIVVAVLSWKLMNVKEAPDLSEEEKEIQAVVIEDKAAQAFVTEKEYFYQLDPFVVNLTDLDNVHFLKATIEIEVRREEILKELEQRTPQIRDIILFILMNKSYDDVITNEGKEKVKHELIARVNHSLRTGLLEELYLTDFIVQ